MKHTPYSKLKVKDVVEVITSDSSWLEVGVRYMVDSIEGKSLHLRNEGHYDLCRSGNTRRSKLKRVGRINRVGNFVKEPD